MIVTVTPNPALDLTYHVDRLLVGASQRVQAPVVRAGGKGVNVARVLHGRGVPVTVVAPTGGASGATFAADLDAAGIARELLEVEHATRSTIAIVTATETTNLNESGATLSPQDWGRLESAVASLLREPATDGVHVLVCSGSMPPQTPPDAVARLVALAHAHGALCVVDTSGPSLLAAADAGADVLKPNHHELLAVVEEADVVAAATVLARRSAGVVYASLGAAGLLRVGSDGSAGHARLGRTLTGNTTGAGDAAVAAIAADLATGGVTPEQTLRTATAWSAAAVLHPLAGSLTDPGPLLPEITVTAVGPDAPLPTPKD